MEEPMEEPIKINDQTALEFGDTTTDCDSHEDQAQVLNLYKRYLAGEIPSSDSDSDSDSSIDFDYIRKKKEDKCTKKRFSNLNEFTAHNETINKTKLSLGGSDVHDDDIDLDAIQLPWNLKEMNEDHLIEIVNKLYDEIDELERSYPSFELECLRSFVNDTKEFMSDVNKFIKKTSEEDQTKFDLSKVQQQKQQLIKLISEIKINFKKLENSIKDAKAANELLDEGVLITK